MGDRGCCLWVNTLGGLSFTEKFRGLGELPACVSKVGASQVALVVKNPPAKAANAKDAGLIPVSERSPGVEKGNQLQDPCLSNPKGRGSWLQLQRIGHTERLNAQQGWSWTWESSPLDLDDLFF